jgi:hypothetical protein
MKQLVKYIGSNYPEMAGLEGQIHAEATDGSGAKLIAVIWCGKFGPVSGLAERWVPAVQTKPIKKYSKGIVGL